MVVVFVNFLCVYTYIVIDVTSKVYIKYKIKIDLDYNDLDLPVQPIVDGGLVSDPFLPDEPAELLRKGRNCSLQKEMDFLTLSSNYCNGLSSVVDCDLAFFRDLI